MVGGAPATCLSPQDPGVHSAPPENVGEVTGEDGEKEWEDSAVYLIQVTPAVRISQSFSNLWISPNAGLYLCVKRFKLMTFFFSSSDFI